MRTSVRYCHLATRREHQSAACQWEAQPGWAALACPDDEAAIWLERAILAENVGVQRDGSVLRVPVGPNFCLTREIKNVITTVAKTHHYWTEHQASESL